MKILTVLLTLGTLLALPLPAGAGDAHNVVASIKPIHSLVAGVMKSVGEPYLLVGGNQSPHDYAMKPSDAEALQRSKIVFWVGPELERFLEKPVETLAGNARVVTLEDAHGLTKLAFREGGPFEAHDEDDAHEDHNDHSRSEGDHNHDDHGNSEDDHDHDEHNDRAKTDDDHEIHDDHAHGEIDMHLWLDPTNAIAMVHEIAEALAATDPDNANTYKANAEALEKRLDALVAELAADLAPVADRPFVVFHDGYQYFENRFGLQAAGSITVIPDVTPGAARLREIRDKVKKLGATCVFAEPQFDPKLVDIVASGTRARAGVLDPIGAGLDDSPALYFQMIRGMAASFRNCLLQAN